MLINGKEYIPEEAYNEVLTIPDCWVKSPNKVGKGHGEGKYYYGSKTRLGEIFAVDSNFIKCFVLKKDLQQLMANLKIEYDKPKENYRGKKDFSTLYQQRLTLVDSLPDVPLVFEIQYQAQITGQRGYINTNADIYELLRQLCFPNICYLSIMRLINAVDYTDIVYYWKVEVDNKILYARNRKEPYAERYGQGNISASVRKGQTSYRNKLMKEFNQQCAVTGVDIPALLVASHIKPWKSSKDKEKNDPNNGILLSTLFDRLFDQGFITFDKNSRMLVSSWLTSENKNRLHIEDRVCADIPQTPERESYLKFHRNFIFKGIIE